MLFFSITDIRTILYYWKVYSVSQREGQYKFTEQLFAIYFSTTGGWQRKIKQRTVYIVFVTTQLRLESDTHFHHKMQTAVFFSSFTLLKLDFENNFSDLGKAC